MDEYNLERFVKAQSASYGSYQVALNEIRSGRKRTHWMWYVFPQITGLGYNVSETTRRYEINCMDEAARFLDHAILGSRLIEITSALLALRTNDAAAIFGAPDHLKLRSSMTLFSLVKSAPPIFQESLSKFFGGLPDLKTIEILESLGEF